MRRYGARVVRLYHDFRDHVDYSRILTRRPDACAVHGHVALDALRSAFPEARTAVWFRDPLERIRSYHAYWRSVKPRGNPVHDTFLQGDQTLRSLAYLLRHEVSGYLGATPVEALDFVGLVEHFEEDLARFDRWCDAAGLGRNVPWSPRDRLARWGVQLDALRAPRANRTRRTPTEPEEIDAKVREILQEELALYMRAQARRNLDATRDAEAGRARHRG